jgi:hypothetical protein
MKHEAFPATRKLMHQKQYRRKANMLKKASEYSKMCDADVCVGNFLVDEFLDRVVFKAAIVS